MRRPPAHKFWFLILLLLTIFALFSAVIYTRNAQALNLDILQNKTFEVANVASDFVPVIVQSWDPITKLQEAKNLVASASLDLKVGKKDIVYYEKRVGYTSGGIPVITKKKITDPEREIALVLLDVQSGDLDLVKITERGNEISSPIGYEINNVERPNGIINNAWNTCRQVTTPKNKIVILNVWPHYTTIKVANPVLNKKGQVIKTNYTNKEIVENVVYSPYCDEVGERFPAFIENGKNYRKSIPAQAFEILRDKGVKSKAFPDKLVADVEYLKPEYFERLPLIEHMDYGEFSLSPYISAERVDTIIGTNMEKAYNLTCSRAGACGWLQYTRKTWNDMSNKYKLADLPSFELGASNHVDSMVAAILLHDNNLKAAIDKFGLKILENTSQLEEMLAANYNGGTVNPHKALKASILKSLTDWLINPMKTETKQYIEKLRFIRETYK